MSFDRHHPAGAATERDDLAPFTGGRHTDIDFELRCQFARMTPTQEAVLRLRHGIGTGRKRSLEEVAGLVGVYWQDVMRIEDEAVSRMPARERVAWRRRTLACLADARTASRAAREKAA